MEFRPLHGGQLHQIADRFRIPLPELLDFSANINPDNDSQRPWSKEAPHRACAREAMYHQNRLSTSVAAGEYRVSRNLDLGRFERILTGHVYSSILWCLLHV